MGTDLGLRCAGNVQVDVSFNPGQRYQQTRFFSRLTFPVGFILLYAAYWVVYAGLRVAHARTLVLTRAYGARGALSTGSPCWYTSCCTVLLLLLLLPVLKADYSATRC